MSAAQVRPYHHGDLRAALLEQAEDTLERTGVTGLSLRELARAVGVSHGAPRRHFPDKDALLAALAQDGWARLEAVLVAAGRTSGPVPDRIRATAHAYVGFATEHPALLTLMFAIKHSPAASPSLVEAALASFAPVLALLVEGQGAGAVVDGDPERIGVTVFSTVHGIAALASAGMLDPQQVPATVDEAVDRLLVGLVPR